jgi:hypothetical protein
MNKTIEGQAYISSLKQFRSKNFDDALPTQRKETSAGTAQFLLCRENKN